MRRLGLSFGELGVAVEVSQDQGRQLERTLAFGRRAEDERKRMTLQGGWGTKAIHEVFRSGTEPEVEWCAAADALLQDEVRTPPVVFRDRLMTDAVLGNMPIKTEHSYSLSSDGDSMSADSPISLESKMDDMEEECFPAIPMNTASGGSRTCLGTRSTSVSGSKNIVSGNSQSSDDHTASLALGHQSPSSAGCGSSPAAAASASTASSPMDGLVVVKDEPLSTPSSPASSAPSSPPLSPGSPFAPASPISSSHHSIKQEYKAGNQQSLLKQPTILLAARSTLFSQQNRVVVPKINIKLEPSSTGFSLPPTPPSSSTSDNEGNLSPIHHQPSSPAAGAAGHSRHGRGQQQNAATRLYLSASGSSSRQPIQTPLISSQPKGSTGVLMLTEEEKRTLLAEGYPIPTRLPLTKAEEKSLKKIRRKIKNKISAQESRRKKKEYMDALEKKVENLSNENSEYKKKIENLEGNNASLLSQLQKLQALVGGHSTSSSPSSRINRTAGTQTAGAPSSLHMPYPVTRSSIK
ncbi:cyclic AMP response element-binding protein A-like [Hetaerina americana]|uniref:cyclic AMP response element-binding protein A-like n=1 Tax=Hetaerina americana TaxID=62018 RepID=UPI003A7F2BF0